MLLVLIFRLTDTADIGKNGRHLMHSMQPITIHKEYCSINEYLL